MAVTAYQIITAKNTAELNAAIEAGSFTPVGQILTGYGYAQQAVGTGTLDLGAVSDYQVLQADSPEGLADAVNAAIEDGLQPVGGVGRLYRAYIQAVGVVEASGVAAITTAGGTTIPAGTLQATLQAIADLADPAGA